MHLLSGSIDASHQSLKTHHCGLKQIAWRKNLWQMKSGFYPPLGIEEGPLCYCLIKCFINLLEKKTRQCALKESHCCHASRPAGKKDSSHCADQVFALTMVYLNINEQANISEFFQTGIWSSVWGTLEKLNAYTVEVNILNSVVINDSNVPLFHYLQHLLWWHYSFSLT